MWPGPIRRWTRRGDRGSPTRLLPDCLCGEAITSSKSRTGDRAFLLRGHSLLGLCLQTLTSLATRAALGLSGIFCSSLDRITILGQSMCEQLLNDRIHFLTIDHLDHTVLGPKNSETTL